MRHGAADVHGRSESTALRTVALGVLVVMDRLWPIFCFGLVVGCASAPRVPDPWQRQYGTRTDCRGTSGTECFQYFNLVRANPHRICQAESAYPANMRRSDCYRTFGVADPGFVDPSDLEAALRTAGAEQSEALWTLVNQASRGDVRSRETLRRLTLDDPALPHRAEVLSWLAERGDDRALAALADVVLRGEPRDERVKSLPYLAKLRSPAVAKVLLEAIASPDSELSRSALNYAQHRPDIPPDQFWRVALSAAKRVNAAECRELLSEHLHSKTRETLRALEALLSDPEVGRIADGLLTMALGIAREPTQAISEARMKEIAFWARAGRLPAYLPHVEDEATVTRFESEREAYEFSNVRLTGPIISDPSAASRVYVGTEGREPPQRSTLLMEVRDSAGQSRWAQAEPRVVGGRDFCEPLPGKCRFPSWLPEGNYLVFAGPGDRRLLPASGRYEVTFESAYRAYRFGPLVFGGSNGATKAQPIQVVAPPTAPSAPRYK